MKKFFGLLLIIYSFWCCTLITYAEEVSDDITSSNLGLTNTDGAALSFPGEYLGDEVWKFNYGFSQSEVDIRAVSYRIYYNFEAGHTYRFMIDTPFPSVDDAYYQIFYNGLASGLQYKICDYVKQQTVLGGSRYYEGGSFYYTAYEFVEGADNIYIQYSYAPSPTGYITLSGTGAVTSHIYLYVYDETADLIVQVQGTIVDGTNQITGAVDGAADEITGAVDGAADEITGAVSDAADDIIANQNNIWQQEQDIYASVDTGGLNSNNDTLAGAADDMGGLSSDLLGGANDYMSQVDFTAVSLGTQTTAGLTFLLQWITKYWGELDEVAPVFILSLTAGLILLLLGRGAHAAISHDSRQKAKQARADARRMNTFDGS